MSRDIRDKRLAYKPFDYPVYFEEGWMKQQQAHWLHTEIQMNADVSDWKLKLSESEKNIVGTILKGFAQTETLVGDYWSSLVPKWFPLPEIQQMAMVFGAFETIHATAYSYLNETLGLDDFESFLQDEATMNKLEALMNVDDDESDESVARSLAIFSAFAEGVSLYSSFAVLLSFQMRDMLKGIGQQIKWSVRDESLHSKMGIFLFNHLCRQRPGLKESVKNDIYSAAKMVVKLEHEFIDHVFDKTNLENLSSSELKNFISARANDRLSELGLSQIFTVDNSQVDSMDWFGHLTGGHTHTDFFAMRPTDYSKAGEQEDWGDDIWTE